MKKLVILDGGMGRELKRMGAPFSQPLWSAQALIESPQHVLKAHHNFIQAGAEIIIANSYACVPFHLGEQGFEQQGATLATLAGQLARQSVEESSTAVKVAGCIPPAFGSYRPDLFDPQTGEAIFDTLYQAQKPFVDLWLAETISSVAEARSIANVLKTSDKPCHYAFTLLDEQEHDAKLRSGESIKQALMTLLETNAQGIFFNCSVPEVMESAIRQTRSLLDELGQDMDIGVYANSFTPIRSDHKANEAIQALRYFSPQEYLDFAKAWHLAGANIIGGCCGISPEHIERLSQWQQSLKGD
ncbi:homocysteine S-methyltransferase family protein [Vibrio sp. SCSIO 43136]|uniref:homocysteine S-methyltransferase family protein n=1 Tax=Vibrio sp. SCSIO 43136 TaxID=2819101 RepID=UPI00207542FD|nr:homocysteine S-methyltransferase family protein [Vibrio sp. SCSIO 43136]USD67344.1 homocysteine S-methyltransferase family protein [Vibrio sp. SCSIO 43136]